jgi:hypothetical protein
MGESGEAEQGAGEQDRRKQFVRHEDPFDMNTTAKPEPDRPSRLRSCRIAPFRRFGVSKVCHCGGVLLAFALGICRITKMPQRLTALNFEIAVRMSL